MQVPEGLPASIILDIAIIVIAHCRDVDGCRQSFNLQLQGVVAREQCRVLQSVVGGIWRRRQWTPVFKILIVLPGGADVQRFSVVWEGDGEEEKGDGEEEQELPPDESVLPCHYDG